MFSLLLNVVSAIALFGQPCRLNERLISNLVKKLIHPMIIKLFPPIGAKELYREGDECGHLIASILNGSGEKINMLPMNANLNRGAWKQMENTWAKALQDGKTVKVKIEPLYRANDVRPAGFRVMYSIDKAPYQKITFKNSPGGI